MNKDPEISEFDKRQALILRTQRYSRAFLRLILAGVVITMLPLLLLGFHISFICQGLLLTFVRLSPIWNPAKNVVNRIIGLAEGESLFPNRKFSTWQKLLLFLSTLPWLALTGVGIWLLITQGFLELNLIHILFFR
jgi:hypothetical protein